MTAFRSALFHGHVRHARYRPKRHRFTYRTFSMLLDIDEIDQLSAKLRFFSHNKFNLLSFYTRDHGAKDGTPLRPFIESLLAREGIAAPDDIHMLCYPRMLGFVFNPITVYYCVSKNGTKSGTNSKLSALVYEVNNTFGDDHVYVIPMRRQDNPLRHERDKRLHVSPFMGMKARYSFTAELPEDELKLVIRETYDDAPILLASFHGQRKPVKDSVLLKSFFAYPLMTLKIVAGIHFEALRLFLKGVPFIKRPPPQDKRISY
jgi:DUF1365 family protein